MIKNILIIQARMLSSRLPGKVLKELGNISILNLILKRVSLVKNIDKICIATTIDKSDDILVESILKNNNCEIFRGDIDDVQSRFISIANKYKPCNIIRITADCPFIDPFIISEIVNEFNLSKNLDYISNVSPPTFPDGLDIEMFTFDALLKSRKKNNSKYNAEHVTPFIRESGIFNCKNYYSSLKDMSHLRLTVDEDIDLETVQNIYMQLGEQYDFTYEDLYKLYKKKPFLFEKNIFIERNEGASLNNGQKVWKRAKKAIAGGNMLLSKRPDMFLPDRWPTYYESAKGCEIIDLDGNKLLDCSVMGVGTNILGYANEKVDNEVLKALKKGNMTTLNCPEEVELAEELIKLHPWANSIKFARSGGEANAIAIRIARAFSGNDKVAVCGYHGWHDWYLSANIKSNENLNEHLIPGLNPNGVPLNLKETVFPFSYNDLDGLKKIIENQNIGIIKMEFVRNEPINLDFLQAIRELSAKKNIILIFDECTSGFREALGGVHLKYKIYPDIAMFGKALGNGYAVTAVVGKKNIMDAAQESFISSTFWTERIGSVAGLATLKEMKRIQSWSVITEQGKKIQKTITYLAKKNNIDISVYGIPALTGFTFNSKNSLKYKTYLTQEMLKDSILAATNFYVSVCHTDEILEKYYLSLDKIFFSINLFENNKKNIDEFLETSICSSGFKRLN